MEDIGLEGDQIAHNGYQPVQSNIKQNYAALKKTSELQKKIERQRDMARRSTSFTDQQAKKSAFVSRSRKSFHLRWLNTQDLNCSRLSVPANNSRVTQKDMNKAISSTDQQPLVAIRSDDSEEDEFDVPRLPKAAHKEITEQLIKDGYNLDLEPDDEDLDLIPPRPLNERCACCHITNSCSIL